MNEFDLYDNIVISNVYNNLRAECLLAKITFIMTDTPDALPLTKQHCLYLHPAENVLLRSADRSLNNIFKQIWEMETWEVL